MMPRVRYCRHPPRVRQIVMIWFVPMLTDAIRTIPDYPKPGILFRDITTLLGDAVAFREAIDGLAAPFAASRIDKVAGIEARGFILGGAVAHQVSARASCRSARKASCRTPRCGSPIRWNTASTKWKCIATRSARVSACILIDDLIATGGTAEGAASKLLRSLSADIVAAAFVIDLPDLGGAAALRELGVPVTSLVQFPGH
jgi:adenine phosphoribosyltransferase